jgi:Tfp pilus assembly protein PilN
MIKVNLLKSYAALEADFVLEGNVDKQIKVDVAKRAAALLLGPLILWGYESYNIPQMMAQRDSMTNELNALTEFNQRKEAIAAEISKYEEDRKRLNRQTAFLERISRERTYPVILVGRIKEVIPNGVWLSALVTQNNQIEITGSGDTEKGISELESKLAATSILQNVKVQKVDVISPDPKLDLKVRSFTILAEYASEKAIMPEAKDE